MSLVVAAGDLLSVRHTFTNPVTATAMNVLHYRLGSLSGTVPAMTTFLAAVAAQCNAAFLTPWSAAANQDVKLVATRATSVFPLPRSVGVEYVNSPAAPGNVTGEALPLQDAVTILKRTAVGNRWGLGRMYFVGISELQQNSGTIDATIRGHLDDLATHIGSAMTITGTGWTAVLNPCLVRGPEDNPVSITNVISAQVSNNTIKTQRRRRPGKGL